MKKSILALCLGPLCFLLSYFFIGDHFGAGVGLSLWMLVWWVSETLPIAVTALLPIVIWPLTEVLPIKEVTESYGNPIIFLFMGGFMLALAMEKSFLHRRMALYMIRLTGSGSNAMILGFMIASAFLSMWISNTATTVMMLPIAQSVLQWTKKETENTDKKSMRNFTIALLLGVAYAANIGGMATPVGTPPNLVMLGFAREYWGMDIDFFSWMAFALPLCLLLIALCYWLLVKLLFPNHLGSMEQTSKEISSELDKAGKMSLSERRVLYVFIITSLLWITRSYIVKWTALPLNDTIIAITAAILLFVIKGTDGKKLLRWKDTEQLPWGILLLFGGGLSLASGLKETGVIDMMAGTFGDNTPFWLLLLGLTAVSLFLTELMSNVALVTVFVPVVASIALHYGNAEWMLAIPVTLAASCAFMLPMSTPPNAIVFAGGQLKVKNMLRAGIFMNLISIILIFFCCYYIVPFFL